LLKTHWLRVVAITAAFASLVFLTAACGGGEEDGEDGDDRPTAGRTATPEETPGDATGDGVSSQLELTAKDTLWDTDELEAPADQDLTIVLHNEDGGIAHDFDIYTVEEGEAEDLAFDGELFKGIGTETFTVPALEAGTYQFICSVHPATMVGTLIVE